MTLGIDMVGTNLSSGTKTYNLNFCKYLNKISLDETIYIFLIQNYYQNLRSVKNSKIRYIIKPNFYSNIFFRFIWMQIFLPFEIKKLGIKKFYSPMNLSPILLKFSKIKSILTLHTNLPWVFFSKMPGNFLRNLLTKFFMELSINACDRLIVNSSYAKKEIIEKLNLDENKVKTIYLGVDKENFLKKNDLYLKNFDYSDYILSVLSCTKYHNILNLLKAFKILKKNYKKKLKYVFVLQILDKKYFNKINRFIVKNFKNDEIILLHNLENEYLINLYKKANFYVFSSYCEVFGLTSLEAMSNKCPIIISNTSALSEINGNAALYFDPDNSTEIADCMAEVLTNKKIRDELIEKGKIHIKNFNWNKTVVETIKVLNL